LKYFQKIDKCCKCFELMVSDYLNGDLDILGSK
jgi:hypothetical protein